MTLNLDPDELNTCVACGLCLPHCPTFRVTGEEALSPRGRIDAMRAVQWRDAPIDDDFVHFMSTCVQCRGCEPACPSGVPVRSPDRGHPRAPRRRRSHHPVVAAARLPGAAAAPHCCWPARRRSPWPNGCGWCRSGPGWPDCRCVADRPISGTGADAWLFTGCVMDAWLRDTHRSTAQVLDALGVTYAVPGSVGRVLRCAAHPRRAARRVGRAGARASWHRCPGTRRSSSTPPGAGLR